MKIYPIVFVSENEMLFVAEVEDEIAQRLPKKMTKNIITKDGRKFICDIAIVNSYSP